MIIDGHLQQKMQNQLELSKYFPTTNFHKFLFRDSFALSVELNDTPSVDNNSQLIQNVLAYLFTVDQIMKYSYNSFGFL